jgi:quercetin dioxygenase-like cupin family protein
MKRTGCAAFMAAVILCFAQLPGAPHVRVEQLAKTSESWDGTPLPAYPEGKPEVTILKYTIPAKTRLPMHKHNVINAGILLRGNLKVVAEDGRELQLKAGDTIVELVNKWHFGISEGDGPVEIVVFYAGTPTRALTERAAAE